ncbi:hypothetical protein D6827_03015 [Candidatus Parcubacteria bacterium]|nr:MAG: hypothetical protein D6827_03015 [Candidatus Parcubacteria bacterium]
MPTAKKTKAQSSTVKKTATKKTVKRKTPNAKKKKNPAKKLSAKTVKRMPKQVDKANNLNTETMVCEHCSVLPAGTIEIVSLLLVLVFALSAVLAASIYNNHRQEQEILSLQERILLNNGN